MSSHMPPVPPASRSPKGVAKAGDDASKTADTSEHKHGNLDEQGASANIHQNTTNKGYFHGRRVK
jgi:hypothetical protein